MADDQEVVIVDGAGVEHVFPAGFNPKHAAAIVRNGGSSALPTKPVSGEDVTPKKPGALRLLKDVGIGAAKGLGSTVAGIGETAGNAGMLPGVQPAAFNPVMRHPAFTRAEDVTTASNTAQRVGKVAEQVAELALPTGAVAKAVPRMGRAGATLQSVAAAANSVPLDLAKTGDVALRIQQLAGRGGTEPRMVRQLLARATDPSKAPINFEEGRDFYSNISRLSGDEFNRLTGPIKREVGNLRTALNESLTQAADTVGKGGEYAAGIKEYGQAAKLKSGLDSIKTGASKALPVGLGAGAVGGGYYAAKKLLDALLGGQ